MTQLLPFKLGAEVYALELGDIQEVVEQRKVHALPGVPDSIRGAIDFHGRIVPTVDLPNLLGFPAGDRSDRLIVLTDEHGPIALAVDRLLRIVSLDLVHSTLTQSESEKDCIEGVIDRDGEMMSLLDLEQLRQMLVAICTTEGAQE